MDSLIQVQGIHHITLNGANREISINFWQNILGMKFIFEQPNLDNLRIPKVKGSLIIETAGGIMVPITRNFLQIDQIKQWNLPVILVCKLSLIHISEPTRPY